MWIYSKHRGENDNRFLMNLDQCSRVNMMPLGEKWFVEVLFDSETIPIAQVESREEADGIIRAIFEAVKQGTGALDLDEPAKAPAEQPPSPR